MSFMRINGWTIPVKDVSVDIKEIGSRSTSHAGNPLTDIRTTKRIIKGKTRPLTEIQAEAVKGLIRGAGDHWAFDNTAYSDKGIAPDTTNGVRYFRSSADDGDIIVFDIDNSYTITKHISKNNDYVVCVTDDDTENILSVDQGGAENGDPPAGYTAINTATLSADTNNYISGSQSLKCISSAINDGFYTNDAVKAATGWHTYSVYLKSTSNTSIDLSAYDDNGGIYATNTHYLIADTWKHCYVNGYVDSGATNVRLYIEMNESGKTIYADHFQIEPRHAYSLIGNPWIGGQESQTGGTPYYSAGFLTGQQELTVSFWAPTTSETFSDGESLLIVEDSSGSTVLMDDYITIERENVGENLRTGLQVSTGGVTQFTEYADSDPTGTIALYTHVLRRNPETGEYHGYIYVDGVLSSYVSATGKTLPSFDDLYRVYLTGSSQAELYEDLIIVPYAMTAAQVAALYAMDKAWPTMPSFYLDGDIIPDNELTTLFQGKITGIKYIQAGDTSWRSNWQEIEFELMEI